MNNEAKFRPFLSLQFFERGDYRHDLLWSRSGLRPIGKKTIAEIFVNYPVLILDDLFGSENPRSEKNIQVLALHPAAEWRKTANIRNKKPAWNILDFPQRSLHNVAFVLLRNAKWPPERENLISDCDLIAVA
jgi:hypothetical protein